MNRVCKYLIAISAVVMLTDCAATRPLQTAGDVFINAQKDFIAVRRNGTVFDTNYRSGPRWGEKAARYGYLYWNARLTLESGSRYFLIENEQVRRRYFPSGGGVTTRGGSTFSARGTFAAADQYYELKGTVRMFGDRPEIPGVIDAARFLRDARLPSKYSRLAVGESRNAT